METSDLYEVDQLSLFGDQLLFGLSSPVEPDSPVISPGVGYESNQLDLLGIEQLADKPKTADRSPAVELGQITAVVKDSPNGLEVGWMDTKHDIIDLLQEDAATHHGAPECQGNDTGMSPVSVDNIPVISLASTELTWPSTENLLQLTAGENTQENADLESDLLLEAFKLLDKAGVSVDDVVQFKSFLEGTDVNQEGVLVDSEAGITEDQLVAGQSDSGLESLPSSCPESPISIVQPDIAHDTPQAEQPRKSRRGRRMAPYNKLPADRKERKKIQNKTAALKYRQKKKEESQKVFTEVAVLEAKNKELKNKVESITQEIHYLKNLMAEVLKAKLDV